MHILLVEDHPHDAFLIKELLESSEDMSIQITEADSLKLATEALANEEFDAILLDLGLVDSNGLQTFENINKLSPSSPIIILSGNSDQKLALAAVKAGAQDYLQKDEISTKILLKVIHYAIERKQIEEQLREVSMRLHLALSAAKVGTWSINLQTLAVYWDEYQCGLYGIDPSLFSGMIEEVIQRVHPADHERARREILRSVHENVPYDTEHRVLWPDGTIRILAKRGEVQRDISGKPTHLTGVCWDITERKKAEQWFHKHQFELANVSRINSMGEVATTLAHEMNQPLAAVNAFLQGSIHRLATGKFNTDELLNVLKLASQQVERAGKIIERIENFSHRGALIYELTNINSLIEDSCSLIHYHSEIRKSDIQFHFASNLPLIRADKIQLVQVFNNLFNNSIEAFQIGRTENPLISITTHLISDNEVEIVITDNGPGFAVELHEEIFKPYYTTKQNSVGIGLAICRTIIQAHGGTLVAEPAEKVGARFRMTLPIKQF